MTEAKFGHYSCLGATVDHASDRLPESRIEFRLSPFNPMEEGQTPHARRKFRLLFLLLGARQRPSAYLSEIFLISI